MAHETYAKEVTRCCHRTRTPPSSLDTSPCVYEGGHVRAHTHVTTHEAIFSEANSGANQAYLHRVYTQRG